MSEEEYSREQKRKREKMLKRLSSEPRYSGETLKYKGGNYRNSKPRDLNEFDIEERKEKASNAGRSTKLSKFKRSRMVADEIMQNRYLGSRIAGDVDAQAR